MISSAKLTLARVRARLASSLRVMMATESVGCIVLNPPPRRGECFRLLLVNHLLRLGGAGWLLWFQQALILLYGAPVGRGIALSVRPMVAALAELNVGVGLVRE